jgi:Domain of unknown function (DUF4160)
MRGPVASLFPIPRRAKSHAWPASRAGRRDGGAKVWLENVAFARHSGFKAKELSQILTLVRENRKMLLEAWHGYFGTIS